MASTNSFNAHGELKVGDNSYEVYRLDAVEGSDCPGCSPSASIRSRIARCTCAVSVLEAVPGDIRPSHHDSQRRHKTRRAPPERGSPSDLRWW